MKKQTPFFIGMMITSGLMGMFSGYTFGMWTQDWFALFILTISSVLFAMFYVREVYRDKIKKTLKQIKGKRG